MVLERFDFHTTENGGPEMVVIFHKYSPTQGAFSSVVL